MSAPTDPAIASGELPTAMFARPLARGLQHQGDHDRLARIRVSHDHDLAQCGVRLAHLMVGISDEALPPSILGEAQALLDLIQRELEAERQEMQDAGLLPRRTSR